MISRDADREPPFFFLKSFRRRWLLRWFLLRGCLAAAIINEAVRWSTVVLNRWSDLDLPVLDAGPFFLLIALIVTMQRWRPDYTAARADRHLAFQDRFTSLLDFAGRSDLSREVLAAQGAEVREALAGRSPREALPLRPLFFAGPLLLLVSLAYPLFLPSSPFGLVALMRRDSGPATNRNLRSDGTLDTAGDAPRPVQNPAGKNTPAGEPGKSRSRPAPPQQTPSADQGAGKTTVDDPLVPPLGTGPRKGLIAEGPLVSERVGRKLTKVVNPLFQEGTARPARPKESAGGAIAFRLLPKSAKIGSGEGSGSGENPDAVTLNLDAVPEAYRQLVKTYFTLLAGRDRKD